MLTCRCDLLTTGSSLLLNSSLYFLLLTSFFLVILNVVCILDPCIFIARDDSVYVDVPLGAFYPPLAWAQHSALELYKKVKDGEMSSWIFIFFPKPPDFTEIPKILLLFFMSKRKGHSDIFLKVSPTLLFSLEPLNFSEAKIGCSVHSHLYWYCGNPWCHSVWNSLLGRY